MHRNIDLENILIDRAARDTENINMKLGDFALACNLNSDSHKHEGIEGSLNYLAPEMIKRESYGMQVDVWSAMVVVFALITGNLPFYSENKHDLIE